VFNVDADGRLLLVHSIAGTLRLHDIASRTQLGDPINGVTTIDADGQVILEDGLEAAAGTPSAS
jgi:hypothetical protein